LARFACSATSPGAEDGAVVGSGYRAEKGHLPLSSESHLSCFWQGSNMRGQVKTAYTVLTSAWQAHSAAIACGQSLADVGSARIRPFLGRACAFHR
jgi:hypothetical protein